MESGNATFFIWYYIKECYNIHNITCTVWLSVREVFIISRYAKRKSKVKQSDKYPISKLIFENLYIIAIIVFIAIGLIFYFTHK